MVKRTTLSAKEAAEFLGVSYWLVTELVKKKQLPCAKVGGRLLFRIETLNEYLKQKESQSIKT